MDFYDKYKDRCGCVVCSIQFTFVIFSSILELTLVIWIFSFVWTLPNSIERLFLLMSNTGIVFDKNWWMATAQELVGVSKPATGSLKVNVMSSRVTGTEEETKVILCPLELWMMNTRSRCCWHHFNSEFYMLPSILIHNFFSFLKKKY